MASVDCRRIEELVPELTALVGRLVEALQSRSAVLTDAEVEALTGYQQPAAQLRVLIARGFHRAHRNMTGRVILERPHFETISRGYPVDPDAGLRVPLEGTGPKWRVSAHDMPVRR